MTEKMESIPRCGDHVLHKPTGETWLVAFVEGDILAPAGLPDTRVRLQDCKLVARCSDEKHAEHVEIWRQVSDDSKREAVLRLYGGQSQAA